MTPAEMDKKIEFILQMQAQFEANLARSEANINNLRVSVADLRASVGELKITVGDIAVVVRESIKFSDDRFTRFDQMMMELAGAQRTTGERLRELAEAQKTTDDRLNALINVTEKHITGPDHAARP
jgi:hypothetical protein